MSVANDSPDESVQDDGLPVVAPDRVEEALADQIDNIVPSYGYRQKYMVGLGGSAGSIAALEAFFTRVPADTGMVFVVVLHLSPTHYSALPDMLLRWMTMPVTRAEDGEEVVANHVYVIPPARHLTVVNGHLKLTPVEHEAGKRVAVDLFFRSLADSHGAHGAAGVLSGADGDGALGVKRIKERGGLTIAQNPQEAEYSGMPRAAIASGMVDWVLSVSEIPGRILEYVKKERLLKLPPEDARLPDAPPAQDVAHAETAFREILVFPRTRTGRDFTYYERATIGPRYSLDFAKHAG